MEAERSGAGKHSLASMGTFLTQVLVQCQELQEMTKGNFRNSVPGKAHATCGQGEFALTRHPLDPVQHQTPHSSDSA